MVLLSIALSSNVALASDDVSKAYFAVVSYGRCLVQYDAFFGPPLPDPGIGDYNEWESPTGAFIFAGKALTEDWSGGPPGDIYTPPGEWEVTLAGTMKAYGSLKVSWTYNGVNYVIQGQISPTSQTYGLLEPGKNWLSIKGSAGMMDFTGSYEVDNLVTPLQCGCTFLLVGDALSPDYPTLLVRVQFPGWPTSVITFYWHVPPALVLMNEVIIK